MADRLHALEFSGLELDAEERLGRDNEVNVVEGVPFGNVGGGKARDGDERIVVEEISEEGGEARVDFVLLQRDLEGVSDSLRYYKRGNNEVVLVRNDG